MSRSRSVWVNRFPTPRKARHQGLEPCPAGLESAMPPTTPATHKVWVDRFGLPTFAPQTRRSDQAELYPDKAAGLRREVLVLGTTPQQRKRQDSDLQSLSTQQFSKLSPCHSDRFQSGEYRSWTYLPVGHSFTDCSGRQCRSFPKLAADNTQRRKRPP